MIHIRRGNTGGTRLHYLYARTGGVLATYYVVVGFTSLPSRFRGLIFVRSRYARASEIVARTSCARVQADRCTGRPYVTTLPAQGCRERTEVTLLIDPAIRRIASRDAHRIPVLIVSETMPRLLCRPRQRLFSERRANTLAVSVYDHRLTPRHYRNDTFAVQRTFLIFAGNQAKISRRLAPH
jgi:hypothetical protein